MAKADPGLNPPKRTVSDKEVDEFLNLIKNIDYRAVDQLNHTPSKISIMSLLLSSKAHIKSLMKILDSSHVTRDITWNNLMAS